MIDKIAMRYNVGYDTDIVELARHLKCKYPSHYKEEINAEGIKSYRAEINNLKIYMNVDYIYITGSLNRFYLGNNVQVLLTKDIPKAFDSINSALVQLIDIRKAFVLKMEIGTNLPMKYKCSEYISKIHSNNSKNATRFNDQTIDTSNGSRGMIIYDKTAEAKQKSKKNKQSVEIPDKLLRLEAKLKARHVFQKHFGSNLPTVSDIIEHIDLLPEIWYQEYIKLNKEYSISTKPIVTKQDLLNYTITKAGFDDCMYTINHSYNIGLISKQSKARYAKSVKNAFDELRDKYEEEDLMNELDEKVLAWYNQVRTR
ncbi:phage/plasmid replication domain-containing protein [Spirosoma pomorum]